MDWQVTSAAKGQLPASRIAVCACSVLCGAPGQARSKVGWHLTLWIPRPRTLLSCAARPEAGSGQPDSGRGGGQRGQPPHAAVREL